MQDVRIMKETDGLQGLQEKSVGFGLCQSLLLPQVGVQVPLFSVLQDHGNDVILLETAVEFDDMRMAQL